MSEEAQALMQRIGNANAFVADNEADAAYCFSCAGCSAAYIISQPRLLR
jgi:hypothetical protein